MLSEQPNAHRRVLVIDDNPKIHEDFRKILLTNNKDLELADAEAEFFGEELDSTATASLDIDLDSAYQGQEALEKVIEAIESNHPYAFAFCDMRMPPGWDGLTTIEALWKVDPNLHIVICSAYSDKSWSMITDRLGRSDRLLILKKPFDNSEVLQLAVALIEKRRLADQERRVREGLVGVVAERTRNLEAAQLRSDCLISAIDSLLIELKADGTVQRWNRTAEKLLGIEASQAVGRSLLDLNLQWNDPDTVRNLIENNRQTSSQQFEIQLIDPHGNQRTIQFSSYPVLALGKYLGALILGTDLTETRELEEQVHQLRKLHSNQDLTAEVADEINQPLKFMGQNLGDLEVTLGRLLDFTHACMATIDKITVTDTESDSGNSLLPIPKDIDLNGLSTSALTSLNQSRQAIGQVVRILQTLSPSQSPIVP